MKKTSKLSKQARDNLFELIHPKLLETYSEGIIASHPSRILLSSIVSIIFSISTAPFSFSIIILKKLIPILLIGITWLVLLNQVKDINTGSVKTLVQILIVFSFVFLLLDDLVHYLESEIRDLFIYFIFIISGGLVLKWICKGFLARNGFRYNILYSRPFEPIVAEQAVFLPKTYRNKYDAIFDLYFETNGPNAIDELKDKLEEYEQVMPHELYKP